jgi:hypothetical protein
MDADDGCTRLYPSRELRISFTVVVERVDSEKQKVRWIGRPACEQAKSNATTSDGGRMAGVRLRGGKRRLSELPSSRL